MTAGALLFGKGGLFGVGRSEASNIVFINIFFRFVFIKLLQIYKFYKTNSTFRIIDF